MACSWEVVKFGWGSAHSAPQVPLLDLRGPTFKGGEGKGGEGSKGRG